MTWRVSWTGSGGAGGVLDAALGVPFGFTDSGRARRGTGDKPVSSQPPGRNRNRLLPGAGRRRRTAAATAAAPAQAPGRLRGLPRRRRPAMIALAVAMAGAGVLISAAVYQRADHQVAVVMVTQPVPAGAVITAGDLGTHERHVSAPGSSVIPAAQMGQVTGEIAAVALRPATLLAPADLTTAQPPGPGQVLVPAPVKP